MNALFVYGVYGTKNPIEEPANVKSNRRNRTMHDGSACP